MERRSPAVCKVSDHKEGKDEMTKASIDLQDLRRRIYVKAEAEVLEVLGIVRPCLQAGNATRGVCAGQKERWGSGK